MARTRHKGPYRAEARKRRKERNKRKLLESILAFHREWGNLKDRTHKYGITPDEYLTILEDQNGICAVCQDYSRSENLVIDHDHRTGQVRGLLCHNCNVGLGMLGDTRQVVDRLLQYLTKPR